MTSLQTFSLKPDSILLLGIPTPELPVPLQEQLCTEWESRLAPRLTEAQTQHLARFGRYVGHKKFQRIIIRLAALLYLPQSEPLRGKAPDQLTCGHMGLAFSYSQGSAFGALAPRNYTPLAIDAEAVDGTFPAEAAKAMLKKILPATIPMKEFSPTEMLRIWLGWEVLIKLGQNPAKILDAHAIQQLARHPREMPVDITAMTKLRYFSLNSHLICIGCPNGSPDCLVEPLWLTPQVINACYKTCDFQVPA